MYKEAIKGMQSLRLRLQSMSWTTNKTTEPDFKRNPNLIQNPMLVLTKEALRQ